MPDDERMRNEKHWKGVIISIKPRTLRERRVKTHRRGVGLGMMGKIWKTERDGKDRTVGGRTPSKAKLLNEVE